MARAHYFLIFKETRYLTWEMRPQAAHPLCTLSYSSQWLIMVSFSYERVLFWNFPQINWTKFKLPCIQVGRWIKHYTVPVVSCIVLGRFEAGGSRIKIPQNAQEQRKKPQVQCNALFIYLCSEVWRSFGLFGGKFRTVLSHKRNLPWSTTVTNMKAYTKGGLPVMRHSSLEMSHSLREENLVLRDETLISQESSNLHWPVLCVLRFDQYCVYLHLTSTVCTMYLSKKPAYLF